MLDRLGNYLVTSWSKDSMGYWSKPLRYFVAMESFNSPFIKKSLANILSEIASSDPRLISDLASMRKIPKDLDVNEAMGPRSFDH